MTLLDDVRQGSQEPTTLLVPDGVDLGRGDDALEVAELAGLTLYPWQADVIRRSMMLRSKTDKRWAAREVGVIVPRQAGKGTVMEARQLAGLFLEGERLSLHSAHEFKTAYEHFRRVVDLIEGSPHLIKQVRIIRTGAGDQAIELKNGNRLRFLARSRSSGRGFSGDTIYLDEAFELSDATVGALMPTMSARPNPQLWMLSSAPHPGSTVLHRLRERGIAGADDRLLFYEWANEPGVDPTDPEAWARANPSLGWGITEDAIRAELAAMSPEEFARERLGIPDMPDGAGGVLSVAKWSQLVDNGDPLSLCIALEVDPDRSLSAFGVAGRRADQLIHVEVAELLPGTAGVVERAAELHRRYRTPIIVDPSSPAGALIPSLVAEGVEVDEMSTRELTQACGAFADAITNAEVRHIGQSQLDAAVGAARYRSVADAQAFVRAPKQCPLMAVTLALGRVPAARRPTLYFSAD
jgi:hypothetical protein